MKKALLTVPVRKPHRQEFVRVHADPGYRLETATLQVKEDREYYIVDPSLWADLPGELVPTMLFTTISRQGVVFLWPIRLPDQNGRHDAWSRSAFDAAELATQGWIRIAANMSLGAYEVFQAAAHLPGPEWPSETFPTLLRIAFRDRFINAPDHPVLRKLEGQL